LVYLLRALFAILLLVSIGSLRVIEHLFPLFTIGCLVVIEGLLLELGLLVL
jgi:hypothetical protein